MKELFDRYSAPDLATAVFAVVVVAVLIYAASTSSVAFATFNPSWEGTSELRSIADESGADTSLIESTERYDEFDTEENTLVLVIEPEEPYTTEEEERIREFVERGGTLVVADGSGDPSNSLLAAIGASTRIDGDPLRDDRHHYESPALPVAPETVDHPYTDGAESLTLNHGTALAQTDGTVLVESSNFSYLDRNRSGMLDDEEPRSHPVATTEAVGAGEVIIVSDSSAFTNVMLERSGNRAFASNVLADRDHVALDNTRAAELPPLIYATIVLRESALLQMSLGTGLVLGLAFLARRPGAIDRLLGGPNGRGEEDPLAGVERSPAQLRSQLANRYPDWSEEKREQVITVITRGKQNESE